MVCVCVLDKKAKQDMKERKEKKPKKVKNLGSIIVVTDHKDKIEDTGEKQYIYFIIYYVYTSVIDDSNNETENSNTQKYAALKKSNGNGTIKSVCVCFITLTIDVDNLSDTGGTPSSSKSGIGRYFIC